MDHRLAAVVLHGAAHAGESPLQFWASQSSHFPGKSADRLHRLSTAAVGGQIVRASWYGGSERLNHQAAMGESFQPWARTAAHRSLPFGTRLEVTSLATGRSTVVRINDRGPAAYTGRALDLSRGAASDLGLFGAGDARVAIRILN
jgi:rare lipoprotein A